MEIKKVFSKFNFKKSLNDLFKKAGIVPNRGTMTKNRASD